MFLKKVLGETKKVVNIDVNSIKSSPDRHRKSFDEYELWKLSASIKENGILQPLYVIKIEDNYQLVSGYRRLRAAKMAGLKAVPCIVGDQSLQDAVIFAINENMQRCNLNLFEQASAIQTLINQYGLTTDAAAQKLGMAQTTLSNKLKLLSFDEAEQVKIILFDITEQQALYLLRIQDKQKREEVLQEVIAKQLSASQTESLVESIINPQSQPVLPQRYCAVGDIRLFINSLNKLVNTLCESGISANLSNKETAEYTEYTVRIQKQGHPLRLV